MALYLYSINRNINFNELWNEIRECYKSFDLRCVALKNNSNWRNVFFTCFLSRRNKNVIKKSVEEDYSSLKKLGLGDVEEIGIFYDVSDVQYLPKYVEQMQAGQIILPNNVTIYLREGWERSSIYESPRTFSFGEYGEYPIINYEFYSKDTPTINKELDSTLSSLGFLNTVDEIGNQWLKMPSLRSYGLNGVIVFPIYCKISDLSILNDEFKATLQLHKHLRAKLRTLIALRRNIYGNYLIVENNPITLDKASMKSVDEDICELYIKYKFNTLPKQDDQIYFRVFGKLGILYHELVTVKDLVERKTLKEVPFLSKLISSYIEKYGYKPGMNYNVGNVDSLEWHVYHVLGSVFPLIWIGLMEDYWRRVFKELGLDETVDFISFIDNSLILIECIQKYTTDKGDIGEREVKKLLYLKDKFSKLGFITYPILICGESYEENKAYFEEKIREDVHFIFNEGLKQIQKEIHLIKRPEDLVRYSQKKVPKIESY